MPNLEKAVLQLIFPIFKTYPDIDIGSYPYSQEGGFGTVLVMRAVDEAKVLRCKEEVEEMIRKHTSN
jgi:hypothetical protein